MSNTRITTDIHDVVSIEVGSRRELGSGAFGTFVRKILLTTEDGTRYEITAFSPDEEGVEITY